jgi:membrane protein implicated in regulation of membrane protease activity
MRGVITFLQWYVLAALLACALGLREGMAFIKWFFAAAVLALASSVVTYAWFRFPLSLALGFIAIVLWDTWQAKRETRKMANRSRS